MPVSMELREDGWVYYYVFVDPWTLEDLAPLIEQNTTYRNQSSHAVHTLMNMNNAKRLPPGALSLRHASPDLNHATAGQIVLVGPNAFVRSVAELIFRLARADKFKIFPTEDEAWAHLRKVIGESSQGRA